MKSLIALLLAGLTITSQGQVVNDYQPDSDGDGCIGMSDLLSLLSVFGSCETQAFACGDPINYQGYDYATVQIGEQCWFAENLRIETYANGDAIPAGLSDDEWENTLSGAAAVFGEGSSACSDYNPDGDACDEAWSLSEHGRLYNWYAVDDARGLCPSGWHVPTDGEWMTMEMALGMSEAEANDNGWRGTDQGTQMKTAYGWYGGDGTNTSGFSGLPGGIRSHAGGFVNGGRSGVWWSSDAQSDSFAWYRDVYRGYEEVGRNPVTMNFGFSVRCIQDSEE